MINVSARSAQDLERMNNQLHELREAVLAISSDLSLPEVLQRIVIAAATLAHAKYAALGVPMSRAKPLPNLWCMEFRRTRENVSRIRREAWVCWA